MIDTLRPVKQALGVDSNLRLNHSMFSYDPSSEPSRLVSFDVTNLWQPSVRTDVAF